MIGLRATSMRPTTLEVMLASAESELGISAK